MSLHPPPVASRGLFSTGREEGWASPGPEKKENLALHSGWSLKPWNLFQTQLHTWVFFLEFGAAPPKLSQAFAASGGIQWPPWHCHKSPPSLATDFWPFRGKQEGTGRWQQPGNAAGRCSRGEKLELGRVQGHQGAIWEKIILFIT